MMEPNCIKLFGCLCTPVKEMLCGCTLRSGVICLGTFDILCAFLGLVNLKRVILLLLSKESSLIEYLFFFSILTAILIGASAIRGIIGIMKFEIEKLEHYTYMKKIGFFIQSLISSLLLILWLHNTPNESYTIILVTYGFLLTCLTLLHLYFLLVVWSAYIRLIYNEASLVMFGIEGAMIVEAGSLELQDDPIQLFPS